ncbi:hypothetical protein DesLBE_4965 [Desulfitobacterium sp. LBE]|uniref:YlxR domain-containing protein n=4 Tax=Desulfitobacterium hafniense TaxID=49338 RepID=Q24UI4_DESHY|nr:MULTISPECIES: YlxR family protein [Desulfitobacterium]ACL21695.1 protein of unknown function DUF448 [Desulfitobacterium hafniense DCB-2]KTE90772.1 nucleic acid-binding protein [Desulfitobacterium hafniense]TWH60524.1 hypothetical protein DesLBE_4965 [Desulfitobacterium sp. LBE]BAE84308.1 hypothetical protein DSY2519 [Desulfitobacterium hafniense Y51]
MKTRKIPLRMCLGCQEMKPKKELIRVVRTPEGAVELDLTGKRNGRGAYICPDIECFKAAVKGKRFQKALEIELAPQVIEELERKLGREC